MNQATLLGLFTHLKIQNIHLLRFVLSALQMDGTSKPIPTGLLNAQLEFSAFQRNSSK
jgi:hypothetical protein